MKRKNQINWRKIATIAFVLCIVAGSFGIAAAQPSASVTPSSQQVDAGDQFTLDIDVNPGTYGVSAGELQFAFDASVLQVDDVVFGDLMAAPSSSAKVIDNAAGTVLFAGYNMGAPPVPTAPGTFATITITVNASAPNGTYALDITSLGLSDEQPELIPGITITDGTVTVGDGGTPPTIVSYTISNYTLVLPQTTEIDVEFSEQVEAWIKIEDTNRDLVNELYHSASVKNPKSKTWDGTNTTGIQVPDGNYYVNVSGTNTTTGLSVTNNTEIITVSSAPYYGVDITADKNTETIVQGGTATYTLTVTNTGNVADTVDLTVEAGIGTLSTSSVALAAGAGDDVTLEVTNNTIGDHVTTINATSQGDVTKYATVTVTTTVAEPFYGVDLTADKTAETIAQGGTATYTLTVNNTGNVPDTINLTVEAGIGALSTGSVALAAGASDDVTLEVTNNTIGDYVTTINATSQGDATKYATVTVTTTVEEVIPQPSANVTPPSQEVDAGDQFTINITVNPDIYGISGGELQFAFDASVLQVDDVVFGDLMAAPSSSKKDINNTAGTVLFAGYNMGAPPVPTAPGTFATITITVDASAPTGTYDLDITSMGLADENADAISGITITDGTVTVIPPVANYGVELTVDKNRETIYTTETATYTLTVTNTGEVADTVELTKDGIGTLSTSSVTLEADESTTVTLEVSSNTANDYETTVTATSQGDPTKYDTETVRTIVERRATGGGGGGSYRPLDSDGDGIFDWDELFAGTDSNDPCDPNTESAACLAIRPPTPAPTPAAPTPTVAVPPPAATPTPTPTPIPEASEAPEGIFQQPGFEAIFVIAGVLVVAFLLVKRKRK